MARTAGKKQAPAKVEDDDDDDGWEDAVVEADGSDGQADLRLRDWRDVERFREMKDLRRLVDDDYGLEEIFHIPLKPRPEAPARASKLPAMLAPKAPPPKAAAKAHAPARHAPAKHAAAHKAAPKAKARAKAKPKAKKR